MASGRLVFTGRMPAIDADGVPFPDARMFFYVNRTTTLAVVYADEALTTPLANPVLADSSGQFVPVWADQDLLFSASLESITLGQIDTIDDLAPSNSVGGAADKLDRDGGNPEPMFLENVGALGIAENLSDVPDNNVALLNLDVVYAEAFVDFEGANDNGDFSLAIQRAHDSLTTAGTIRVRSGTKELKSEVTITKPVRIQGEGWREGPTPGLGTWFSVQTTGFNPFLVTGADAAGFQMVDVAWWQLHPTVIDAPWTPTDYPAVIKLLDVAGGCFLDNVLFTNINKWIDSVGSGRTSGGRIWGMSLRAAITIDNALDAPHFLELHVWPFGYAADANYSRVQDWTIANAPIFDLGRVDTPELVTIFALGCQAVVRVRRTAAGTPSKINITNVIADNCKYLIYDPDGDVDGWDAIIGSATMQGLTLTGGVVPIPGARTIMVTSDFVNIQIGTLFCEFLPRYAVEWTGTSGGLQIGNFKPDRTNEDNGGYGVFKVATGNDFRVGNMQPPSTLYPATTPLNDSTSGSQVYLAGKGVGAGELFPVGRANSFTPSSQGGALSAASAFLRFEFDGSWVDCNLDVSITNAGTGTGFIYIDSIPFTSFLDFYAVGENRSTGFAVALRMSQSGTQIRIAHIDGTTAIQSGANINVSFRIQRRALV